MLTKGMPPQTRFVILSAAVTAMGLIAWNVGMWFDLRGLMIDGIIIAVVGAVFQGGHLIFLNMRSKRLEAECDVLIKELDAKREAFIKLMSEEV